MSAVQLEGVEVRYGSVVAVCGVHLEVADGEVHALLGASGSGKSTVLRAVAGFEPLWAGQVSIGGQVVEQAGRRGVVPPEGRGVGVVFQDYALFPHLDVAGNVAFGMARPDPAEVDRLLQRVGLTGLGRRLPSELSGGQQQRVALARALARRPRLLLLDEPFSNVDQRLRRALRVETANILREAGVAALFVTHDVEEAFSVGDRCSVLSSARLAQTGPPQALYQEPATRVVAEAVGPASFLAGEVADEGRAVRCALGELPLRRPARDGAVLVRPEQVRLGQGVPARVLRRSWLGADVELDLSLEGGERLLARVRAEGLPAEEAVRVSVAGPVVRVG